MLERPSPAKEARLEAFSESKLYRFDKELLRGSPVVEDEERSRDCLKLEYAVGVGASMLDGSRSAEVLKLSCDDGAVPVVVVAPLLALLAGTNARELSVEPFGGSAVVVAVKAAVVASLTALIKFSLAAVHGNSGFVKDSASL